MCLRHAKYSCLHGNNCIVFRNGLKPPDEAAKLTNQQFAFPFSKIFLVGFQ